MMTSIKMQGRLTCFFALCLLAAASADGADQPSAATTVIYQWSNGTVAPQYYQVHRLTIRSSGLSEVSVITGADRKEQKTAFDADRAQLKKLLDYIRSNGLDVAPATDSSAPARPRPGDGTCNLQFVVGDASYAVPCNARGVPALLDMMRALVPPSQPTPTTRPPSAALDVGLANSPC
jgi:hypothetical protein